MPAKLRIIETRIIEDGREPSRPEPPIEAQGTFSVSYEEKPFRLVRAGYDSDGPYVEGDGIAPERFAFEGIEWEPDPDSIPDVSTIEGTFAWMSIHQQNGRTLRYRPI